MERHEGSEIIIPHPAEMLRAVPSTASDAISDKDRAAHEPAALRSAVRLLTEAGRAMSDNKDDARRYIVRAVALLQAEADFRDQGIESAGAITRCRLAPWQVTRVLRFIDIHLGEKIGPKDFADLTRLSVSHFARAFRATVGEPPHAYVIRRRVERAKELMLETDIPLAQIALDCGLADQAHMTRHFSRIAGISPGAWRRAHLAAAPKQTQENTPIPAPGRVNGVQHCEASVVPTIRRAA